jgi:hypothetical protein
LKISSPCKEDEKSIKGYTVEYIERRKKPEADKLTNAVVHKYHYSPMYFSK